MLTAALQAESSVVRSLDEFIFNRITLQLSDAPLQLSTLKLPLKTATKLFCTGRR